MTQAVFRRLIRRRQFPVLFALSLGVSFVYRSAVKYPGTVVGAYIATAEALSVAMGFIILDEATSGLDADTEARVWQAVS